jgi:hypothetical protein
VSGIESARWAILDTGFLILDAGTYRVGLADFTLISAIYVCLLWQVGRPPTADLRWPVFGSNRPIFDIILDFERKVNGKGRKNAAWSVERIGGGSKREKVKGTHYTGKVEKDGFRVKRRLSGKE